MFRWIILQDDKISISPRSYSNESNFHIKTSREGMYWSICCSWIVFLYLFACISCILTLEKLNHNRRHYHYHEKLWHNDESSSRISQIITIQAYPLQCVVCLSSVNYSRQQQQHQPNIVQLVLWTVLRSIVLKIK